MHFCTFKRKTKILFTLVSFIQNLNFKLNLKLNFSPHQTVFKLLKKTSSNNEWNLSIRQNKDTNMTSQTVVLISTLVNMNNSQKLFTCFCWLIFTYSALKEWRDNAREYLAGIYLLKVNNGNTRKICEICSKLRIKTPERPHLNIVWHRSNVFIINFEQISNTVNTVFPLSLWINKCHLGYWI